jgi:DNA primase large subunit
MKKNLYDLDPQNPEDFKMLRDTYITIKRLHDIVNERVEILNNENNQLKEKLKNVEFEKNQIYKSNMQQHQIVQNNLIKNTTEIDNIKRELSIAYNDIKKLNNIINEYKQKEKLI